MFKGSEERDFCMVKVSEVVLVYWAGGVGKLWACLGIRFASCLFIQVLANNFLVFHFFCSVMNF